MHIEKLVRVALSCSFALGLAGCADEEQSGNLTIQYELGANISSCSEEGVVNMKATFKESIDEDEPCNDEGEFTASGIPAGSYSQFLMEGIDGEGITIYDSLLDDDARPMKVVGGSTQMAEVRLSPTPAQVRVSFNLLDENGFGYTGQDESPVTEFEVEPLEGNTTILRHTFVVAQLAMAQNNVVPDEGRDINGLDLDGVRIDAIVDGESTTVEVMGEPVFHFDPPGRGRVVDIRVDCMADVCTGRLLGTDEGATTTGGETDSDTDSVDGSSG